MELVIAITGASGAIYGIRLLEVLKKLPGIKTHLIISKSAALTISSETNFKISKVKSLADVVHSVDDISACLASGSYKTHGMIIAPCSIKTMSAIANSFCDNLITRSADVMLKEQRKLVLMLRETPLHYIHLQNLARIAQTGGIIFPPVPNFYSKPKTIDDIVNFTIYKVLDLFAVEINEFKRWNGLS